MMTECYGNPSSLHSKGFAAAKEMTAAREIIAERLSAQPGEIYFTSGGTESDNIAILGAAHAKKRAGNKIVTTAIEHPAVLNTMTQLEKAVSYKHLRRIPFAGDARPHCAYYGGEFKAFSGG